MVMTRMKRAAIAVYFCLMGFGTTHAIAQADMIGIYFDQSAISDRFTTTETPEVVSAWVCITSLSAPSGLWAVSCSGFANADFCGQSIIGYQMGVCGVEWDFAADPPLPHESVLAVVECWAVVPAPSSRVDLYIRPAGVLPPGLPGPSAYYYDNSNPRSAVPLHPVSGSYDIPVAVINEGAVADSQLPFGSIKLLFR